MNALRAPKTKFLLSLAATVVAQLCTQHAYAASTPAPSASAPAVTMLTRIEVGPAKYGALLLTKDLAGQPLYLTLQDIPGETQIQNLVAIDASGKTIAQNKVWASLPPEHLLSIRDVGFNSRGELIAILGTGSNVTGDISLESNNLTKQTSVPLVSTGRSPQFGGRLVVKGHNVVVVTADLNSRTNTTDPSIVRVIDEDTGKVLSQSILDFNAQAELGIASNGKLKVLAYGYELFGIIDVASGKYSDLIPPRQQPSVYPGTLELSIGKFMTVSDTKVQKLYLRKDLLNGVLKSVQEFAVSTQFLKSSGASVPDYAVERTETSLKIVNLKTGVAEGPAIPIGMAGRVDAGVVEVAKTPQGLVAVVSAAYNPHSYVRGAMLDYVNVKTGKLLRHSQRKEDELHPKMFIAPNGHLLTLERVEMFGFSTEPHFILADLDTGTELSSGMTDLISEASLSNSKQIFALLSDHGQVCAINLLEPKAETCINDPKIIGDVVYGYEPYSIEGAVVTLPLLKSNGSSITELGYATLRVD